MPLRLVFHLCFPVWTQFFRGSRRELRRCVRAAAVVFGIIKLGTGFRQFLLRGIAKVTGGWNLVALPYNWRRLQTLVLAQTA